VCLCLVFDTLSAVLPTLSIPVALNRRSVLLFCYFIHIYHTERERGELARLLFFPLYMDTIITIVVITTIGLSTSIYLSYGCGNHNHIFA